jgi:hypothetical protein
MVPTIERPVVVGVVCANTEVNARTAPTVAAAVATPIFKRLLFGTFALLD